MPKTVTVWFTGLPSSGKTTVAVEVLRALRCRDRAAELLDGDEIRRWLWPELGFSKEDRDKNVRRLGYIANLISRNGVITLVAAVSPYRAVRDEVRVLLGAFIEVYVSAPVETCFNRDTKGLYKKATEGEIKNLTGFDDPYEPPLSPEVMIDTSRSSLFECSRKVLDALGGKI